MIQRFYRALSGASPYAKSILLLPGRLPTWVIYFVSVIATKGISLITLPIVAAYLPAAEYGDYDVAVSFIEFVNLILGFAVGATLIRFASTAGGEQSSRQVAAELTGTTLTLAIIVGVPLVIFGPVITDWLSIRVDATALRVILAGVVLTSMIELPLFWLRLKDRALSYFAVIIVRTLAQAGFMWLALAMGYGAAGILIVNGAIMISVAAVLLFMQYRETGIAISQTALRQIIVYGLPIVGADLAMYGLGNCNKLFMPGHVDSTTIAHFALAARVALIISLATAPFDLWWAPKRIATLTQEGGLELGARMWGIGTALVIFAGTGVALGGPLLIHLLFPASYGGAYNYLYPLVLLQSAHIITTFTNVGSYARASGSHVFAIEVFSAAIAVTGYALLVEPFGVSGVMASMAAGQATRFTLHLWLGKELAPLPYPWLPALASIAGAILIVALAPAAGDLLWRFLYGLLAAPILIGLIIASGLVQIPADFAANVRRRFC